MLSKISLHITIISILLLTACMRNLSYEEFTAYLNNPKNGLVQEKLINGTNIKFTYRPSELLVYQELGRTDSLAKKDILEARERYSKQHYFVLSFSQGGKEILSNAADRQRFSQLVNQFAFGIGDKVTLVTSARDTLQILDFHYARYFGMATSTDILFAFEKEEKNVEELIFSVNEFGLKTGDVRFKISKNNIQKLEKKKITHKN